MAEAKQTAVYTPRLKALYNDTYTKELQTELKLDNVNQVPRLEKIVVSVGTGKSKDDNRTSAGRTTCEKINRNIQNSQRHGRANGRNGHIARCSHVRVP